MKIAFGLLAVVGVAAAATADFSISREEIGSGSVGPAAISTVYSGVPGPYSAFGRAAGNAGFDDYTSTAGSNFNMAKFVFVGGVANAGESMRFEFYDAAAVLVNSATLALPSGGDFIWTITFGTLPDGSDSTFGVANAGFVQIVTTVGTGRWFFTSTAPTVGANNVAVGTGAGLNPQRNNAFEIVMAPTPGSLALLGLGGLAAARRRR